MLKLQSDLWHELENVLIQESLMSAQRDRTEWNLLGDKNTKFFHLRANGRRRVNHISTIKDDFGNWIYDEEEIKVKAIEFFLS